MDNEALDYAFYVAGLITRKRETGLSGAEEEALNSWLNASEANKQLYQELSDESNLQQIMMELMQADVARVTRVAMQKLSFNDPVVPRVSFLRKYRWAAAAVFLFFIATGVYFWLKPAPTTPPITQTTPRNDVSPGKNGALLTLADGRTVVLDSLGNGVIAMQGGAEVTLLNGQLAYHTDGSTAYPQTGVLYNTMSTPRGRQFNLTLPDGSKVWLNAASSIKFPTTFSGQERKVEITGEAYFEVAHNPAKPFRVHFAAALPGSSAPTTGVIEVLGTRFNVNAYPDEGCVNTSLLEGSVQISAGNNRGIKLVPGQQLSMSPASVKMSGEVDMEEVMAWKNELFKFNSTDIQALVRQMERWYDVEVSFPKGIPADRFSGVISRNVNLSQFLTILKYSDVHAEIEDGKVRITP